MANLEVIRRFSEEFFGYSPTIFHLPNDSEGMAASFADALDIQDLHEPFLEFLTEACEHPFIDGLAFVIDAWEGEVCGKPGGAHVYVHYFVNETMLPENQVWQTVRLPHELDIIVDRAFHREFERSKRMFTLSASLWDVSDIGFEEGLKLLVKTIFARDAGLFGTDRSEEDPPSGFVVAAIERENV